MSTGTGWCCPAVPHPFARPPPGCPACRPQGFRTRTDVTCAPHPFRSCSSRSLLQVDEYVSFHDECINYYVSMLNDLDDWQKIFAAALTSGKAVREPDSDTDSDTDSDGWTSF